MMTMNIETVIIFLRQLQKNLPANYFLEALSLTVLVSRMAIKQIESPTLHPQTVRNLKISNKIRY